MRPFCAVMRGFWGHFVLLLGGLGAIFEGFMSFQGYFWLVRGGSEWLTRVMPTLRTFEGLGHDTSTFVVIRYLIIRTVH